MRTGAEAYRLVTFVEDNVEPQEKAMHMVISRSLELERDLKCQLFFCDRVQIQFLDWHS